MNTHKIARFQIIDHGIEHSQYFQGCGTSYTNFDYCVTGCGGNATEAFDDALEQIASGAYGSVDLTPIEESQDYKTAQTKRVKAFTVEKCLRREGLLKRNQDMSDLPDCELYYYLSIRYNLAMSDERLMRAAGLA